MNRSRRINTHTKQQREGSCTGRFIGVASRFVCGGLSRTIFAVAPLPDPSRVHGRETRAAAPCSSSLERRSSKGLQKTCSKWQHTETMEEVRRPNPRNCMKTAVFKAARWAGWKSSDCTIGRYFVGFLEARLGLVLGGDGASASTGSCGCGGDRSGSWVCGRRGLDASRNVRSWRCSAGK